MFPTFDLPPLVRLAYEIEIANWEERGRPLRNQDAATNRYVYQSVLERFGMKCPHPVKKPLPPRIDGFECEACLVYWIPTP